MLPDAHLMRPRVGLLLALLALVAVLAALAASFAHADRRPSGSGTATLDLAILSQLNQIRTAHGLGPLTVSPSLTAAATAHTHDMISNGYFGHNSANGEPFWKRVADFYPDRNYSYWSVGENLFWSAGRATPGGAVKAWMASPDHRANILDPRWAQIGIAAVNAPAVPGTYLNLDVTVITTDFGVRRRRQDERLNNGTERRRFRPPSPLTFRSGLAAFRVLPSEAASPYSRRARCRRHISGHGHVRKGKR